MRPIVSSLILIVLAPGVCGGGERLVRRGIPRGRGRLARRRKGFDGLSASGGSFTVAAANERSPDWSVPRPAQASVESLPSEGEADLDEFSSRYVHRAPLTLRLGWHF